MPIIRRTAPTVTRSAVTRPAVSSARRVARPAPAQSKQDNYDAVIDKLQLIAIVEAELEAAVRRKQVIEEEIEKLMNEGGHTKVDDGVFRAEIVTPSGKSTTTVDPLKFKKKCGDAAFWACVKIGVTEAKLHLSEKELGTVSTVTPAKPGKPKLNVARVKKGK